MVLPDLPPIASGTVIGNTSGATGRPAALGAPDLATIIGTFTASANGLVPAPVSVPANLAAFYRDNADAVWRPKLGGYQYVTSAQAASRSPAIPGFS